MGCTGSRRCAAVPSRSTGSFSPRIRAAGCRRSTPSLGAQAQPDELYIFDGLYGRDPALGDPLRGIEIVERWLAARIAAEPARPGALRVAFIESQTGPFSRAVGARLAALIATADESRRPALARRYRVEASGVQHSQVARVALPELLADPAADIPWYQPPRF